MHDRQNFADILGIVLRYVLIVVLIMAIVRYSHDAYAIGYEVFSDEAMAAAGEGKEVQVTITQQMSDREVGELLQQDGLIEDARVFPLQVRLSSGGSITPGTYTLSTEMTTNEIVSELTDGSEEAEGSSESASEGSSESASEGSSESTSEGSLEADSEEKAEGASSQAAQESE